MLNDVFVKRFQELKDESDSISFIDYYAPDGSWQKWATSAESLIKAVFGTGSPHYANFAREMGQSSCRAVSAERI